MKLGDLVRINPMYSRDPYGDPKEWKLFDEPWDPFSFKRVGNDSHICTFKEYQVGTVLGFCVKYDPVHRIERKDVKVLVGDRVGWIDESILCKVYE